MALLAKAGRLQALKSLVVVWRSPSSSIRPPHGAARRGSPTCHASANFGAIAVSRDTDGCPAAMPLGPVGAPHDIETARSKIGTLLVRGALVPRAAFPPGVELGPEPYLAADKDGFVDTGFTCRADEEARTLRLSVAPLAASPLSVAIASPSAIDRPGLDGRPAATIVALRAV